jgi:4-hydroxybenzoate polyprenyltransferase
VTRSGTLLSVTRRARIMIALTTFVGTLLTFAPAAFAHADGGQGWWGETTDQQVTNVMFAVIIFFPTVIVIFSIIQWRLDKRKHAREDAMKAREASADWRGGW